MRHERFDLTCLERCTTSTPRPHNAFTSFFLGGFESSTHRRADGRRLDLLAATAHDRLVVEDYQALGHHGITTVRDSVRCAAERYSGATGDHKREVPVGKGLG